MVQSNLWLSWLVLSSTAWCVLSYIAPSKIVFQNGLLRSCPRNLATTKPIYAKDVHRRESSKSIFMTIAENAAQSLKDSVLPMERYVTFNRFQTRAGSGPKFEKRWAERKSSLAQTDGFRFFTLLRRADDVQSTDGKAVSYPVGTPDYMSMSVWETKDTFSSWRKSNAFKEAHGGGSIGGFLSALVSR
jgi:heme-degrading monooxygenase HmoA